MVVRLPSHQLFNGMVCAIVYCELMVGAWMFIALPEHKVIHQQEEPPMEIRSPFEKDTDGCDTDTGLCEELFI